MKFKISLRPTFWNDSPTIIIKLNNNTITQKNNFTDGEKAEILFDIDINNDKNQLTIQRQGKTIQDTLVEDGKIIKDSTIDIIDVVIDKISLEPLLDKANFFPQYPEPWNTEQKEAGNILPKSFKFCRTLHHNGEWKLNFSNPIHIWFFQNVNVVL